MVVVVGRLARDVGVLPRRQVEALEQTELLEEVERPEDGRAADAEPPLPYLVDEVRRSEVALALRDQLADHTPSVRQAVTRALERVTKTEVIGTRWLDT